MQAVTRALNTTAHEETRNFRKLNKQRSRSRKEDSAEIGTRLARLQVITATTIMPRTATRLMIATQVKKMHAKRVTAIRLLAEEDESVAEMTERTATSDVITAANPLSTAGMIVPFAYRSSKATTPGMLMVNRSVPRKQLFLTCGAPGMLMVHRSVPRKELFITCGAPRLTRRRTPIWRGFRLLLATTRNALRVMIKCTKMERVRRCGKISYSPR